MATELRQTLSAQQQLTLTPSLKLSLEVLRMALVELQLYAHQQLEENPLLELVDEAPEETTSEQELAEIEEPFDDLWPTSQVTDDPDDEPISPLERSSRSPSLQENLFFQLCSLNEDERLVRIAQALTEWLDEDGYLRSTLEELSQALGAQPAMLEQAIQLLHRLDPAGVGARNLSECLLIQLARRNLKESLASQIVRDHFDLLARRKLSTLSSRLRVPLDQVQEACRIIANLEPKPARNFTTEVATPLHPDLIIRQTKTGFEVELNDEGVPRFRLSRAYQSLMRCPTTPREAKHFIREKSRQGRWVIKAIAQRNQTLLAIGKEVVKQQKHYFEGGVQFLKPLTQEEIAHRVSCHPSTVSRAIAGKSIQTPYGVVLLDTFFGGGFFHPKENDRRLSPKTIQAELASLINKEDHHSPISDQRLALILAGKGYPLARRTVAKYRTQLNIPPAYLRNHPI